MDVRISSIRFFKHGVQPLLLISERDTGFGRLAISSYLIWPEQLEQGAEIERLMVVSMPLGSGQRTTQQQDAIDCMRLAAIEGATHRAGKLAAHFSQAAEDFALFPASIELLRAWRSLGLFPGLHNLQVLDEAAAKYVMALDSPYSFKVE